MSNHHQFSHKVATAAVVLLARLVRVLPLRIAIGLGRFVGVALSRWSSRDYNIAIGQIDYVRSYLQRNPEKFPDSDFVRRDLSLESARAKLARASFANAGQVAVESLSWSRYRMMPEADSGSPKKAANPKSPIITLADEATLDTIKDLKTGAIAISAHIGCFEILAAYFASRGLPVAVLGRKPNYDIFTSSLDRLRRSYGIEVLWRDERQSIRKMLVMLKQGYIIAALIDQDINLHSVFPEVFGLPASTPIGTIDLALRSEVPIFSAFIVREHERLHTVRLKEIVYDKESADPAKEILQTFSQRFEQLVCSYPEQWVWWHRRWRRNPGIDYHANPSLLRSTHDYLKWLAQQRDETHISVHSFRNDGDGR